MPARPLNLNTLPRITAGPASRISNGPSVAAILQRTAQLKMSPFGSGSLSCVDVVTALPPARSDALWELSRHDDQRAGYLVLDGMSALRILAATWGGPAPRVFRPLGTSERGIVTAVIASALRSLGPELSVSLDPKPWGGTELARLIISAEFPNMRERLLLDLPAPWLPRPPERLMGGLIGATRVLEIPMSLQLAQTTLTAWDWSRARIGDAVMFDVASTGKRAGRWQGKLVCGAYGAEILVEMDGVVILQTPFQPTEDDELATSGRSPHAATIENESGARNQENAMTEDSTFSQTMLAAAPIQVVAEIGRMLMRADEVAALRPGMVLPIDPISPRTVKLRVGDRMWAEGELVDVDGQLGVRLTSMATPAEFRVGQTNDEDTLALVDR